MKKSLASMCLSAVLTVAFSYHAVAADLPEIEKSGTLKVATEDDYAPFNFMNNGQADGFNKDMLEELRKYAKFHVDQSILPWTGLLAAVSTGQYDMALTGAVITDERLKVFDFTPPWASAQHYFVKRAGDTSLNTIADLSGKKVGLQAGSALLARLPELKAMLEKTGGKLGPVVEYPSYPEAYADLANKRLDYVINVVISVNDLAKAKPKVFAKGLAVSGPGYMAWPIPKNSPQLLAVFIYVTLTLFGWPSHAIRLTAKVLKAVHTPEGFLLPVCPLPRSLATTNGISFDVSSSPYLDVSVQAVPLLYL